MCKFAITSKNNAFVAKIANTHLTKIFMATFALAEMLPTSATLMKSLAIKTKEMKTAPLNCQSNLIQYNFHNMKHLGCYALSGTISLFINLPCVLGTCEW